MADPIVYGNPFSTYTRTARMAFEEKGVAFTLDPVDHHAPRISPDPSVRQNSGDAPR